MKKSKNVLFSLWFYLVSSLAIADDSAGNKYIGAMPLSYDLHSSLSNGVFMARASTIAMLKISTINNGKLSIPSITDAGKQKPEADYLLATHQSSSFVTPEVRDVYIKAKSDNNPFERRKAENLWLANEDIERVNLEKANSILFPLEVWFGKYDANNETYPITLANNQVCTTTIEGSNSREKPKNGEYLCIEFDNLTLNKSPFKNLKLPIAEAGKLNNDYPYFFGVLVFAECDIANMKLVNAKKAITKKWVAARDLQNTILMSCPAHRIHLVNHKEMKYQTPISVTRNVIASFEAEKLTVNGVVDNPTENVPKSEIQKKVDQFQDSDTAKLPRRKSKTKSPQEINF